MFDCSIVLPRHQIEQWKAKTDKLGLIKWIPLDEGLEGSEFFETNTKHAGLQLVRFAYWMAHEFAPKTLEAVDELLDIGDYGEPDLVVVESFSTWFNWKFREKGIPTLGLAPATNTALFRLGFNVKWPSQTSQLFMWSITALGS